MRLSDVRWRQSKALYRNHSTLRDLNEADTRSLEPIVRSRYRGVNARTLGLLTPIFFRVYLELYPIHTQALLLGLSRTTPTMSYTIDSPLWRGDALHRSACPASEPNRTRSARPAS